MHAPPAKETGHTMSDDDTMIDAPSGDRTTVLDVFGLKLEVSNPRLAELLLMDAKDALTTDVRELGTPRQIRDLRAEVAEAAPDMVISPMTVKDDMDATLRREMRDRVCGIGRSLDFDAGPDGVWRSPTGLSLITRTIERPVSLAAASHFVGELAGRREQMGGGESSVLFVVEGQQSADVFKVAIRQKRLYDEMRVVSMGNLEEIAGLALSGSLDHTKALILLSPVADVDVGEILSVLRASDDEPYDTDR